MFSKSASNRNAVQDKGPGPGEYDPDTHPDSSKHYGFLEKSNRWKTQSKETLNESELQEQDDLLSRSSSRQSTSLLPHRGEKEEIAKMKKQMERLELNYERQLAVHEKENFMLGERCHKLNNLLTSAIKEKNVVSTAMASRDLKVNELERKLNAMQTKTEKADKATLNWKEKQMHSDLLQKKVDELSKQQERVKVNTKEHEVQKLELKEARTIISKLQSENVTLSHSLEQSKHDAQTYQSKSFELATLIGEGETREAKLKEEAKKTGKSLLLQESSLKDLESKLSSSHLSAALIEKEFAEYQEKMSEEMAQAQADRDNEKSSVTVTIDSLKSSINALQVELERTATSNLQTDQDLALCTSRLESAIRDNQNFKAATEGTISRLEEELESTTGKFTLSQECVLSSKAELQSLSEKHKQTIQSIQDEMKEVLLTQEKNETLLKRNNEIIEERMQKCFLELETLNLKLAESQQTIDSIEHSRASEKSASLLETQRLHTLLQEKEAMVGKLDGAISSLSSELQEKEANFEEKLLESEKTIGELQSATATREIQFKQEKDQYERQIKVFMQSCDRESEKANSAEKELLLLHEELERSNSKYQEMSEELEYVNNLCDGANVALKQKEHEFNEMEIEMNGAKSLHEKEIGDLRLSSESARLDLNESRLKFQQEMADITTEKNLVQSKIEHMELITSARDLQIKNLNERTAELLDELERFQTNGKIEFGAFKERNSELENKVKSQASQFEKYVQESSLRLSEKSGQVHSLEQQLSDSLTTISRWEIHLENEIASRDLAIKSLELQAKDIKLKLERSELALKDSQQLQVKWKAEAEFVKATKQDLQEEAKEFQVKVSQLQAQLHERENEEDGLKIQVELLKESLRESKLAQVKEKDIHDQQLELLEKRGNLKLSEIKKIGELSAETFGHANSRQKIKHVAQLKEQNVKLTENNLALNIERDAIKRKLLNVERELESLRKSHDLGKKTSTAERSFIKSNSTVAKASKRAAPSLQSNKENSDDQSGESSLFNQSEGMGGVSFFVE